MTILAKQRTIIQAEEESTHWIYSARIHLPLIVEVYPYTLSFQEERLMMSVKGNLWSGHHLALK